MKKLNSKLHLYVAAAGLIIILGLVGYYLLAPVSKAEEVVYIYIDDNDTQDSVLVKLQSMNGRAVSNASPQRLRRAHPHR